MWRTTTLKRVSKPGRPLSEAQPSAKGSECCSIPCIDPELKIQQSFLCPSAEPLSKLRLRGIFGLYRLPSKGLLGLMLGGLTIPHVYRHGPSRGDDSNSRLFVYLHPRDLPLKGPLHPDPKGTQDDCFLGTFYKFRGANIEPNIR